jgi:hypothetical protein
VKKGDFLIALIWFVLLAIAFFQGIQVRHATLAPPIRVAYFIIPLFTIFAFGASFLQRRSVLDIPPVRWLVDRKFGVGIYDRFLERLRPVTLLMASALIMGIVGLISTYATTQNYAAYFNGSFFLACGLGLLVAYLLSLRFPPRLA